MSPKKHEVDPITQGSLLAPPPAALSTGMYVESEGAYYRSAPAELSPERKEQKARLQAEFTALDRLALESRAAGRELHTDNRYTRELNELLDSDNDTESSAVLDMLGEIQRKATSMKEVHHLVSKSYFGRSVGVETELAIVKTKNNKDKPVIMAKEEDQRDDFDSQYRIFRFTYYGPRNYKKLNGRRKTLKKDIQAIRP